VKRRRLNLQLSDEQYLILALLLVIVLTISLLYCLGFASLALRQVLEGTPTPGNGASITPQTLDLIPTWPASGPTAQPPPLP
jgi:hypothetical protein